MLGFDTFRLDLDGEQLWQGDRPVELRPKTWQVLRLLVERSGQLVHTSEFLDAVWPDVEVTPGTLTQSIAELRRALGDDAREPRYIQTVHHRGYRFVSEVRSVRPRAVSPPPRLASLPPSPAFDATKSLQGRSLPGRQTELEELDRLMREVQAGHRQIVFVTGEAGIGKTTLIRAFLQDLADDSTGDAVWIAGGKCVEFVGEGETYLPVLETLDRLAHVVGPGPFRQAVSARAPTWLAQIPWLLEPGEQGEGPTPRPKRMLREFCVAMEALAAQGTLVLWFEDLHWSDSATVDLLAALASRTEPARLCVLASYRPVEAAIHAHPIAPLKRGLLQQQACVELPLGLLEKAAVRSYLDRQFAAPFPEALADLLYEQTEGNPLFLVTAVKHLVSSGVLERTDGQSPWTWRGPLDDLQSLVPATLAGLVELQLDPMDPDTRSALEAASVAGVSFGAQSVAAAVGKDVELVERTLKLLAGRGRFLEALGPDSWPDGSMDERFSFSHALFRHILYRRLAAGSRQRYHRRIARRVEEGFPRLAGSLAARLALHFERGGDFSRAVRYFVEAASGVRQRAGDREAVAYFNRALALLAQLPESDERARQELELRMHLWKEVNASGVFSTAEQDASLGRALELCERLGDERCQAYVSSCHTRSLIIQGELEAASAIDRKRADIAKRLGDPILLAAAHSEAGDIAYWRGDLDRSLKEQARCLRTLEGVEPGAAHAVLGHDPGVLALGFRGWARWFQGAPDEARRHTAACLERAEAGGYPLNVAFALALALQVEQFRRDADAAGELAAKLMNLADEYGFDLPYPTIFAILGWTESRNGGLDSAIASLREGLRVCRRTCSLQGLSHHLATLAELELAAGKNREARATIDDALSFVARTGERFWEAEIHRLNGALLLHDGEDECGEASLRKALEVARGQGARSLELRAAISLSRLWREGPRKGEVHSLLTRVYGGFSEGLDARDLRDAGTLLDSL